MEKKIGIKKHAGNVSRFENDFSTFENDFSTFENVFPRFENVFHKGGLIPGSFFILKNM